MAPASPSASLRLTRRGRIVLVLTVLVLAVVGGLTLGYGSSQAAGSAPVHQRTLIVAPGQTLWSVASRVAPHVDPRLVVADLESLNGLSGPQLTPGQQLVVPTYG